MNTDREREIQEREERYAILYRKIQSLSQEIEVLKQERDTAWKIAEQRKNAASVFCYLKVADMIR